MKYGYGNKENQPINNVKIPYNFNKKENIGYESSINLNGVNNKVNILPKEHRQPAIMNKNRELSDLLDPPYLNKQSHIKPQHDDTSHYDKYMDMTDVKDETIFVRNPNLSLISNQDKTIRQESSMELTEVNPNDEIFIRKNKLSPKVVDKDSSFDPLSFSQSNPDHTVRHENSLMDLTKVNQDSIIVRNKRLLSPSLDDTTKHESQSMDLTDVNKETIIIRNPNLTLKANQDETVKQESLMDLTNVNIEDEIFIRSRKISPKAINNDDTTQHETCFMDLTEINNQDSIVLKKRTPVVKFPRRESNLNYDIFSTLSQKEPDDTLKIMMNMPVVSKIPQLNTPSPIRNQVIQEEEEEEEIDIHPDEQTIVSSESSHHFSTPKLLSDIFNMSSENTQGQNTISSISSEEESIREDTIYKLLYNRNISKPDISINPSDMSNSVILKSNSENEILNFRTRDIIPVPETEDITEETLVLEERSDDIDESIPLESEYEYKKVIHLLSSLNGWKPMVVENNHFIIDFRNAIIIDMNFELKSDVLDIKDINYTCKLKDKEENKFLSSLMSTVNLKDIFSMTSLPLAHRLHKASVKIGRLLDLVKELRVVGNSILLDKVGDTGIKARFSNRFTKRKFDMEISFNSDYPYISNLSFEFTSLFGDTTYDDVKKIIDEEIEKSTYRLFTRVCKRLQEIC